MAATRGRKKAKSETAEKLAKALTFVSNATETGAEVWKEHGRIVNGHIITSFGYFSAGHPIDEELSVCPHIARLIGVLNKCGKSLSMVEEGGRLNVKGDNIRAAVPCLQPQDMPQVMPDVQIASLNENVKEGFRLLLPLIREDEDNALQIVERSILLRANTMVSTNRQVMFEYWHGVDLPPGLAIPKAAAKGIAAAEEPLTGFGWTPGRSVTFWFEGGGFMKTNLAQGEWPAIDHLLNVPMNCEALPAGLFDAIEAVREFSPDHGIHWFDDKVKSEYSSYGENGMVAGATYDVPGLRGKHTFSAPLLKLIKPVCAKLDYLTHEDRACFFGPVAVGEDSPKLRGIIMKRS